MANVGNKGILYGDYSKAVTGYVKHLEKAGTLEPRPLQNGYGRAKRMDIVVTSDSLDRYMKANKLKGDEKKALGQVFRTIAGQQSEGQDLTVVRLSKSKLSKLRSKLRGYAKTHNKTVKKYLDKGEVSKMGKTAQAIVKGIDEVQGRDFKKVVSEKAFAKKADKVLEHLLVKANTGSMYMHWYELVNYTKGSGVSNEMKDALWKAFRYVGRTMSHGETNSKKICMDQRREAHRILMKLFAGNSKTKQAIMKV